jgi:hypothetical protein
MYLLLLVFGGLFSAAGVVLAGSGMSLRDERRSSRPRLLQRLAGFS